MANILTFIRIICGLLILVIPAFSKWYYILYLLGWFTDAIDGTVARKTGKATEKGAKFDTVADIIFVLSVVVKLVCNLSVPIWLIIWIVIIAVVKITGVLVGFLRHHRFIAVHSVLNKICGILVFFPPLFVGGPYPASVKIAGLIIVCLFAGIAACIEFVYIWKGKNVD